MTLATRRTWITAIVVALVMALPGIAFAQDSKETTGEKTESEERRDDGAPEDIESVLSTLPVLGSGLDVTVTRGDDGEIASVSLDPSDGATPSEEDEHRVSFLLADGDTEVIVKSGEGVVQTKVKADDPADVSGDASWSGDVFGTGTVTVPYTVSFDGTTPSIAIGAITAPAGVTAEIEEGELETSDDGDKAYYSVDVELEAAGEDDDESEAELSLVAKIRTDDDGESSVYVSATLVSDDHVDCWWGDRYRNDRDRDWRDDDRDHDRDQEDEANRDGDREVAWERDDDRDGDDEWDDRDRDGDWDRDDDSDNDRSEDRRDGDDD